MDWNITKHYFMRRTTLFFIFSISICFLYALFSTTISNRTLYLGIIRNPDSGRKKADCYFQELEKTEEKTDKEEEEEESISGSIIIRRSLFHYSLMSRLSISSSRRYLSVPGSSPPRCTSKCGKCTPCKPVHVPVPPGTPVTTEYYPEAWRCKCGNKLYMP